MSKKWYFLNADFLTYFDTAIYEYFRNLPYDLLYHANNTGTDFHVVRVVIDFCSFPLALMMKLKLMSNHEVFRGSSITFLVEKYSQG